MLIIPPEHLLRSASLIFWPIHSASSLPVACLASAFSFPYPPIHSASSLLVSCLASTFSFPYPATPGACRMWTGEAFGVVMLLGFRPPGNIFQRSSCSARLCPISYRSSARSCRSFDTHQNCAQTKSQPLFCSET